MKTIKHAEFLAILKAQGVPREHYAFTCPACGTVQSSMSLVRAGAGTTFEDVHSTTGFSCVGRFTGAGSPSEEKGKGTGCNWTLGGLFQFHDYEVKTDDGKTHPHFAPASPEEAQALMAKNRVIGTVQGRPVFVGDVLYFDNSDKTPSAQIWEPRTAMNCAHDPAGEVIILDGERRAYCKDLIWQPVIRTTVPSEVLAIARNLKAPNGSYTRQPIMLVQQKKATIGFDPEYIDGDRILVCYLDFDSEEITDPDEIARLEKMYADDEELPDGYTRTGKTESWEDVTTCFTAAGCEAYIKANKKNLRQPRIYAKESAPDSEFLILHNFLLSIANSLNT